MARVAYADGDGGSPVLTGWLPLWTRMAGEDRDWRPPSEGEQVVLLSPFGELASAFILPGLNARSFPAPDVLGAKHVIEYRDGARLEYDAEESTLAFALPGDGAVVTVAPDQLILERGACSLLMTDDGISLEAPAIRVVGPVAFDGSMEVSGDVAIEGGAVSHAGRDIGKSHTHSGVQPGSAVTGPPL